MEKLYINLLYTFCLSIMASVPDSEKFLEAWKIKAKERYDKDVVDRIAEDAIKQLKLIRGSVNGTV